MISVTILLFSGFPHAVRLSRDGMYSYSKESRSCNVDSGLKIEEGTEGKAGRSPRDNMIDVPSWQVGDDWTYYGIIYISFSDNSDYLSLWSNATLTVSKINFYDKNGTLYPAYNLTLSGTVHGKFSVDGTVFHFDGQNSGPPNANQKGSVSGYRVVRASDLSVLHDKMVLQGHIHYEVFPGVWLAPITTIKFISWDIVPVEDIDFPAKNGDSFWYNTTRRRIADVNVADMADYSQHYDSISQYNFTVNGTSNVQDTVIAGVFNTYHLDGSSYINNERSALWYSPVVKNIIRENHLDIKLSSTGTMQDRRELRNYNIAQDENSIELLPSTNLAGSPTRVSGSFPNDPNEDIIVTIPLTGEMWYGKTDGTGDYAVDIISPSSWDPTNTTADNGSFGVCAYMDLNPNNKIMSRTLTIVESDNDGPTADAGSSLSIPEDTLYRFNASGSFDDRAIANFTWEYDSTDGPRSFYGMMPEHSFEIPGNYTLTLTVTDIGGFTDSDFIYVNVLDITPPIVITTPNSSVTKDIGSALFMDGSTSFDPEGGSIVNYTWIIQDFLQGNPEGFIAKIYGANVSYSFYHTGMFRVILTVTDEAGNSGWREFSVEVTDPIPPFADAGPDIIVDQHETVQFNGSGSSDNVGIRANEGYNWSFFYDDSLINLSGPAPSFEFAIAGIYPVTLNVTDTYGNWAIDGMTVTVLDITKPFADAGDDVLVDQHSKVVFNGSGCTDNILVTNLTWSFLDGDPIFLYGSSPEYTFDNAGFYTINLTVKDAMGNLATDELTVTVNDIEEPVADAGGDRVVGVSETVLFNGSGSSDNMGIVDYQWSFIFVGHDGVLKTVETSSASYTFSTIGTYEVSLTVKDPAGNNDTDTILITVTDLTRPEADAGGDITGKAGEIVSFDGSLSSDNINIANFTWSFEYDGQLVKLKGREVSFTFVETGTYNITLNITDDVGNWAEDHMVVKITPSDDLIPEKGETDSRMGEAALGIIIAGIIVVIAVVVVAVLLFARKKKENVEPHELDESIEPEESVPNVPLSSEQGESASPWDNEWNN